SGAVLLVRLIEGSERGAGTALAELAFFGVVLALVTWACERPLLREMIGYLRQRDGGVVAPSP
ncbi:MAG: hypothetical protein H0U84_04805, partial [Thermoleophilaceae bacterium]|nr:hypothetical protein [Thermoleophilaceae bacterium]